jgi:hypothetical protein
VAASFDRHDNGLVAWLASRAYEVRAGDNGRVKGRSGEGGDASDSQFEAVDSVFEELLVPAAGV